MATCLDDDDLDDGFAREMVAAARKMAVGSGSTKMPGSGFALFDAGGQNGIRGSYVRTFTQT